MTVRFSRCAAVLLALLACVQVSPRLAAAEPAEVIRRFQSDITVQEDGTLRVRETIVVRSAGIDIRHGIYRDFPTRYRDRLGHRYNVLFKVLGVERDGFPESYRIERRGNGVRVYIGKADVDLHPAEYVYALTYRTARQLGFFQDRQELYWNATGNGWVFPIQAASAAVTLPANADPESVRLEGYTGAMGSTETAVSARFEPPGRAVFEATRPLEPFEGLTIVVGFPLGIVRPPTVTERVRYFLNDNRCFLIGLIGLLGVFFYYLWEWSRVGRDPLKGTVIPLFTPPENFSPALLRFVARMGSDHKAMAAAIINLAVKGHAVIRESGGKYEISSKEGGAGILTAEERALTQSLFSGGPSIDLKQSNHSAIGSAVTAIETSLKAQAGKTYFALNRGYGVAGLLLSALVLFLAWADGPSLSIGLLTAAGVILNLAFFQLLKVRTPLGRKVMDKIEGFTLFLSVAEKDRLNLLNPPEQTPELFERYLPYALALDVEQHWAEQFTKVFKQAQEQGTPYQPTWYSGSHWNPSRPAQLSSAMGGALAGAIASSATPPGSSSGGGGGGSSGGGGGGGGGGGW